MATVVELTDKLLGIKWKIGLVIAGVFILIMIILDGFVSVPAGHVGVLFDQGRGVLEDELNEGLHLKIPFWQSVTIMDARTQEYTMSIATEEGKIKGDDSIESRTKDGQVVWIDATVLFHIDKTEADNIKKELGAEEEYMTKIVRPRAREVIRTSAAKYNALDLVSETRMNVVKDMEDMLTDAYGKHNIILEEVVLRNVTYSAEFASAVEQKEVARQLIKTAEYQKEQAMELKEKRIIEAEAEAQAITLKGDALRNNPEVIQLQFVEKLAPNISWGIMPDTIAPLINLQKP
ncbi:prohibitin family protein [Candidatus Peregrinibacteria bacterium]|nr:prohibitin family protein [Candidatus Peregrinibacteria bacterium]